MPEHVRAPIILGGAGYSIFPESALRYLGADMGIRAKESGVSCPGERISPRRSGFGYSRHLPPGPARGGQAL